MRALPSDESSDLDFLLFRQSDVLSREQALRFHSPAAIRHKIDSKRWERPQRGVYVVRPVPDDDDQRRWIAVLGAPAGTVTAGRTALQQCGLRGFQVWAIHLLIPATAGVPTVPPGVVVRRTRRLAADDVHHMASPPCTMPARSLVDAAQWARSDDEARTLVAAAFQQRLVGADEVRRVLAGLAQVRRRPVIAAAVNDAAAGAHSLPEMEFLTLCGRARLPRPVLQVRRRDQRGRNRVLDALFEGYGVHAEIDGAQHMDVASWWADMKRQNDVWISGDRVLRFPAWAVRNRPDEVTAAVAAALRAAGWPGPA